MAQLIWVLLICLPFVFSLSHKECSTVEVRNVGHKKTLDGVYRLIDRTCNGRPVYAKETRRDDHHHDHDWKTKKSYIYITDVHTHTPPSQNYKTKSWVIGCSSRCSPRDFDVVSTGGEDALTPDQVTGVWKERTYGWKWMDNPYLGIECLDREPEDGGKEPDNDKGHGADSGLSALTIASIVIGCVAGVLILTIPVIICCCKNKPKNGRKVGIPSARLTTLDVTRLPSTAPEHVGAKPTRVPEDCSVVWTDPTNLFQLPSYEEAVGGGHSMP